MAAEKSTSYLERVRILSHAYPTLKAFVHKIAGPNNGDRQTVQDLYLQRSGRLPGRCALLSFDEEVVQHQDFLTPQDLDAHLSQTSSDISATRRRLWILEDLSAEWIETLGRWLGVDPLVFSEQMNTWNFTDSRTIPAPALLSTADPSKSFTLKYNELRSLNDGYAINSMQNQMTFAVNKRRYERWRDVDTKNFKSNRRHAFIRRCASFWSNQERAGSGWEAVILVDPALDAFRWNDESSPSSSMHKSNTPPSHENVCTILQDPTIYETNKELWAARSKALKPAIDTTEPYHDGSSTLSRITANQIMAADVDQDVRRNLSSPLDEIVYHWTRVASPAMIASARRTSVNSAHYLLKYLATQWSHQLDLIEYGVAQSEYFADDHQASIDSETSTGDAFRAELTEVTSATKDMNYMQRQLNHFTRAMTLNLERMGVVPGAESVDSEAPAAIRDAQKDFLAIYSRMKPYHERVAGLSGMANDLANLQTAFKSIKDSEFGLRLSLIGSIVFPMTLVASLLSMGDDYLAGNSQFWVFWAASVPLVLVFAFMLLFGRKPERFLREKLKGMPKAQSKSHDEIALARFSGNAKTTV